MGHTIFGSCVTFKLRQFEHVTKQLSNMRNLYHLLNAATERMLVEVAPTCVYGLCYQKAHRWCQINSIGENKIIRCQNGT